MTNLFRYVLASAALLAACLSLVFGSAAVLFDRNSKAGVTAAARLVPFSSTYLTRLSGWEPEHRTELLQRAAAANPFSDQAWIQLGFDAEFHRKDLAAAAKDFRHAAAISHMFLPRWTLANFYFRRENHAAFLDWARSALQITPYQADPVFAEMWLVDPNADQVAADVPDRPIVLAQYITFLMNLRQFAAIPPIVKRLVGITGPGGAQWFGLNNILGPALDRMLSSGYPDAALKVWSILFSGAWIHLPLPNPSHPLTNGDLQTPVWGHGFDWVMMTNPGTFIGQSPGTGEIGIEFSGDEQKCVLLTQWVPLTAGRTYRLQWRATSKDLAKASGIVWHVHAAKADLFSPEILSQTTAEWNFQAPNGTDPNEINACLLSLEYSRQMGETRANGNLTLQSVSLQPE